MKVSFRSFIPRINTEMRRKKSQKVSLSYFNTFRTLEKEADEGAREG